MLNVNYTCNVNETVSKFRLTSDLLAVRYATFSKRCTKIYIGIL